MFDKFLFKQFAVSVTPRTLLRNINGIYYDENYNELDKDKIDIVSMFCSFDKLIVKPSIDSSSGRNILFFDKNIDGLFVNKGSGETLSIPFLTTFFGKNFLVQEVLKQSPFMSQFCKTSVNTLRVQIYRSVKNSEIVIPNVIMRIGKSGSLVDNAHAGGCFVGVGTDGMIHDRVCNNMVKQAMCLMALIFRKKYLLSQSFLKSSSLQLKLVSVFLIFIVLHWIL